MRTRRKNKKTLNSHWLFAALGLMAFFLITVNSTSDDNKKQEYLALKEAEESSVLLNSQSENKRLPLDVSNQDSGQLTLPDNTLILSEHLLADASGVIAPPHPSAHLSTDRISIDVREANILDVFTMLAYKLNVNILYLENTDRLVTFNTESLSPLTTFETLLQKEQLDYIILGRNYIVGNRDRLYEDFRYRIYLTKRNLNYVSATAMESYVQELGIDLLSLVVDANQKALWFQGTPMALSKASEIIEMLDIRENADLELGEQLISRYNLAYVSAQAMEGYLSTMGIPVVTLTVDNNYRTIWVQGTPAALAKTKALIKVVDIVENYDPNVEKPLMARFDLDYINAELMKRYLIQALNIPGDAIITVGANPNTIWVQGSPRDLSKTEDLISILDIAENFDQEGIHTPDQWTTIGSWSGEGIMSTETFTTRANEWRVSWRTFDEAGDGLGMLQINVYNEAGNLIDTVANVQGETQGSSMVRTTPGGYYMQINSANVKWEVRAEEREAGTPAPIDSEQVLARVNLRHINADTMAELVNNFASEMGIAVNIRTVETNQRAIWFQVAPESLTRVRDLVAMLDVRDNSELGEFDLPLAGFGLVYISADALESYIDQMGIEVQSLTIDQNQRKIWLKGPISALEKIQELIDTLDVLENADLPLDSTPLTRIDLSHVSAGAMASYLSVLDISLNSLVIDENQKILWLQGTPAMIEKAETMIEMLDIRENADLAEDDPPLTRIDLNFVSATAMENYLSDLGMNIQIITVDVNQQLLWIKGNPLALSETQRLIEMLDISDNADLPDGEELLTRISLNHISATLMANYLSELNIDAQILSVDTSRQLLWIKGTPTVLSEVHSLVNELDIAAHTDQPEEDINLERVELIHISTNLVQEFINNLDIPVQLLSVDPSQPAVWLKGTTGALDRARDLIGRIDILENAEIDGGEAVLTSYTLTYVTAETMKDILNELRLPLENVITVEGNIQMIWIKASPLALAKAGEVISSVDIHESGKFGEGGTRIFRMPVAMARGDHSLDDLYGLVELLSFLLDGIIELRKPSSTDQNVWYHPGGEISWDDPVIRPGEIRLVISGDFATDGRSTVRYLIAEGNMKNIELVKSMIDEIENTGTFSFSTVDGEAEEIDAPDSPPDNGNDNGNNQDSTPQGGVNYQSLPQHTVTAIAVPAQGGTVSGAGTYAQGSTATIRVTAAEGYEFVRLVEGGAELSRSTVYSFPIYLNRNVDALFVKKADSDEVDSDND